MVEEIEGRAEGTVGELDLVLESGSRDLGLGGKRVLLAERRDVLQNGGDVCGVIVAQVVGG